MSKEYFEKKGFISYSLLKELSSSPRDAYSMLQGDKRSSLALDFGSLVDTMISNPEDVERDFAVFSGTIPTDKMYDVSLKYVELYKDAGEEPDEDSIALNARAEIGYQSNWKNETFLTKFKEACGDFVTFILYNSDKIFVDRGTYDKALQLVTYTKQSQFLQHIFNPEPNTEVLFQVPIFVNTTKFDGKILIDCVVIDHNEKTITPYDFKTYEGSFVTNYYKYKYYYQEVWYSFILHTLTDPNFYIDVDLPEAMKVLLGGLYRVEKFKFIAIDKSFNRTPIIYQSYKNVSNDVMFEGRLDRGLVSFIKVKAIGDLIEEFSYRMKNDNWVEDYDMLINGVKMI